MVYMEPQSLGWRPVVMSWMKKLPPGVNKQNKELLNDMFERFIDPCLALVRKKVKELSPTTDTNLVYALMNLIDCQLDEFQDESKIAQMEDREVTAWIEVPYCFKR